MIDPNHKTSYNSEREKRWALAEEKEEIAVLEICERLFNILRVDRQNIEPIRYDKILFKKYNPEIYENEWVKGSPDYCIKIKLQSNYKYFYIEVKLKCIEYQKTKNGGMTKNGSKITNYGCTSYYLDIDPVYRNMNLFCKNIGLSDSNFCIAFIKDDLSEIRLIRLSRINEMVNNGWKGKSLCVFGEGYGKDTYLIPKDATIDISNLTQDRFSEVAADIFVASRV